LSESGVREARSIDLVRRVHAFLLEGSGRILNQHQYRPPSGALATSYPERAISPPKVLAGAYDVVVAGGVESMSPDPMGSAVAGADLYGLSGRLRASGHLR